MTGARCDDGCSTAGLSADTTFVPQHHTFEDVLSSAKYLHENKIAAKGKIILNGGSNGGLTVMASTNMAKEEHGIGASVAEVGVLDLLRFHLFSIGRAWVGGEYCDSARALISPR